jgi:IS5 family transposase
MGYKKMDPSLTFADLALESSLQHNRSLKFMQKLDSAINWSRVERILLSHYTIGTSGQGADAYPPLLLFKCLLLQKWFRINSDPELENQINDRLSFKRFLALSFDKPSPDHSTFSRFRSRLSKNAMDEINSEILRQFEAKGLTINEGIAVDARLVKSSSRPVSNDRLKQLKDKHNSAEGKLDKNAKPKSSVATLIRIGWSKKISLTMGSKSMPRWIPTMALSWPPP